MRTSYKILIAAGTCLAVTGFSVMWHIATMFPTTDPPIMRPIEGVDRIFFHNAFAFRLMGVTGITTLITGLVLWRKK